MNVLGLKRDFKQKEIVDLKDLTGFIKLSDFNIVQSDDKALNIDILTAEILPISSKDLEIKEIINDDNNIIITSFISNLLINLNISGNVKSVNHKIYIYNSFVHKCSKDEIHISPVDLDLHIIKEEIYFAITYVFSKDKNSACFEKNPSEEYISTKEEVRVDYRYIDINKEFM